MRESCFCFGVVGVRCSGVMEGCTESSSSRVMESSYSPNNKSRRLRAKVDAYNEILWRLRELRVKEAMRPDFEDDLWAHFSRLPNR